MFELEQQLRDWKSHFSQIETLQDADVEELEQHVRDSIAELTAKGLSEEEAFWVATRRVGPPGPVGREFGKVNGGRVWTRRLARLPVGFLALALLNIASVGAIAWMLELQIDGLSRTMGPLRAALDEQVVIDQYEFSPGKCRFYFPLDRHKSAADLIESFESNVMINYVSAGSYGEEWILANERRGKIIPNVDESLADAGVTPGAVYRVERARRVEDGRLVF